MIRQLRHLLRDLKYYARKHPLKVFMLIIMPLLTGGALHSVLRKFGIRLPGVGAGGRRGGFDSGISSSLGSLVSGGSAQSLMRTVKSFM